MFVKSNIGEMALILGIRVILLLQDCDQVLKGVGLRNYHAIHSTFKPCEITPSTPYLAPISTMGDPRSPHVPRKRCARVRVSGPARERSCPPRSGGLWCGLPVLLEG